MFQNPNSSDRRILTFPAVHPCEAISPATLLASLIDLCRQICNHQTKIFVTQKRNARETIRLIGILLIFFEELRDASAVLPDSIVLCFSELHLTFQKVLFLFEDCSRSNAKVLMLMKSQFVATQFWVLIRALATALDVLPSNRINTGDEVKELVELVVKQARIAKFGLDEDDELTMKRLQSILLQLEKGTEPDWTAIKRVLNYLEIRRWSDCNKEIKFLEEEIEFQYSDLKEERDVQILSSLVGFMSYNRVTLFETLDFRDKKQGEFQCNPETLRCLNPEDFRCPISLELMFDPVTVSTGQTYDRASIQKWLSAGNLICPKTGERLMRSELVPNSSLKKLINQFCADNGISMAKFNARSHDITRTMIPGSPTAAEAMKFTSEFLLRRLVFGTNTEKNKAAYEIRLLAKSNIFNRACLVKSGVIPPLLNLLSSTTEKSTQENAIAAVLKLSKHSIGKISVVENGGLTPILSVLKSGFCLESRQLAAATLFYLSSVKEHRKLIGEIPDAITGLIELVKEGTTCGKKNAVVAIFGLLLHSKNNKIILNSGVVPLLIDIIATADSDELISDSLAVIAALAESSEGSNAILQASALPLLITTLNSASSSAGKEYSISALRSLCNHGGEGVVVALAGDRSIATTLYSVVTEGNSTAGKKARSLLRILHKFRENDAG